LLVGGDDLTGALRDLAPVVTTTSIILCFSNHWLTRVRLENGQLNGERVLVTTLLLLAVFSLY